MTSDLLRVDDAKVHFGGVRALDGVSLRLKEGSLCGLIGPNGSGKSTLVNVISGVTRADSGTVLWGEHDLTSTRANSMSGLGIARTFQSIRLVPTLNVYENVLVGAENGSSATSTSRASRRRSTRDAAHDALSELGLLDLKERRPSQLSYGTQRRVEIARALAGNPRLLLLDEPVAGMNRSERAQIAQILLAIRARGITQLLIEHDLRTVLDVCDHLYVLNFGKCIADGPPRATAGLDHVRDAYLGGRRARA